MPDERGVFVKRNGLFTASVDGETHDPSIKLLKDRFSLEYLLLFLQKLLEMEVVPPQDYEHVQQMHSTVFFKSTVATVIINALLRVELQLEFSKTLLSDLRAKQSLANIITSLSSTELHWLIRPNSIFCNEETTQDNLGEDARAELSSLASCWLGNSSNYLRIQSKSSDKHVLKFLNTLLQMSKTSENPHWIGRDPTKQPLVVLNGQQSPEVLQTHAVFQILAQITSQKGIDRPTILQLLRTLPIQTVLSVYELAFQDGTAEPVVITEMSLLLQISDSFKARGQRTTPAATPQDGQDPRILAILSCISEVTEPVFSTL